MFFFSDRCNGLERHRTSLEIGVGLAQNGIKHNTIDHWIMFEHIRMFQIVGMQCYSNSKICVDVQSSLNDATSFGTEINPSQKDIFWDKIIFPSQKTFPERVIRVELATNKIRRKRILGGNSYFLGRFFGPKKAVLLQWVQGKKKS